MRLISFIVYFLFLCELGFSQWSSIRVVSPNASMVDLDMVNMDTVFAVGSVFEQGSFVLRTFNGGEDWDSTWFGGFDFTGIDFPTQENGYISSFHNSRVAILKTTDTGDNWFVSEDSIIIAQSVPCDIEFYDANIGVVSLPAWSAISTDAGDTWNEIENHPLGGQRDININEDIYIGMSGTVLTYSVDFCDNFETVILPYSGSHNSMDANEDLLISTAIGSNGTDFGFPDDSFGIITNSSFPYEIQSILYLPFVSRFYDVSIAPNNTSIIHGVVLENNSTLKFVKSVNGGNTWNYIDQEGFSYSNAAYIECEDDNICFAISNLPGEIYKTVNGGGLLGEEVNQTVLGNNELKDKKAQFNLYPNPSSNQITIQCEARIDKVEIFDVLGREVLVENSPSKDGLLNISNLPPGWFMVRIQTINGESGIRKFVVE